MQPEKATVATNSTILMINDNDKSKPLHRGCNHKRTLETVETGNTARSTVKSVCDLSQVTCRSTCLLKHLFLRDAMPCSALAAELLELCQHLALCPAKCTTAKFCQPASSVLRTQKIPFGCCSIYQDTIASTPMPQRIITAL